MFYDGDYILLVLVPLILGLWAQTRVGSTYAKWSRVGSRSGMTGAEVAAAVMRSAGIDNVQIVEIGGHLTDHYDAQNKRLALSSENYRGTSLAALGVAAHESGHAIQDKEHYAALEMRMSLVPVTNIASSILPIVLFGGFFLQAVGLIYLAIAAYLILTIFQLVTMPVEFDASRRALQRLQGLGILTPEEMVGARDTLKAAAWTYVAAFIAALGWLLHLLLIVNGGRRRSF
ncbi:MAG TPA: zinc metallopeptidase [Opitutales bacterium]|nr:zinc metallopeptidase [Opitutales bacterium]